MKDESSAERSQNASDFSTSVLDLKHKQCIKGNAASGSIKCENKIKRFPGTKEIRSFTFHASFYGRVLRV